MSWFKKRGSKKAEETSSLEAPEPGMPKLPRLPEISELPKLSELPSMRKIKQTITPPPIGIPETRQVSPATIIQPTTPIQAPAIPATSPPPTYPTSIDEPEPIFVKIDKFKEAVENFSEVKEKVSDIENMLHEINEVKTKEEQELREWEHEVQLIKTRVENIDNSLFKKLK